MEGSKRQKDFETLWAERFANAEVEPAEHVWKNISGELANNQVGTYKKRLVYYKWAAVASLFVAFTLGALYFGQMDPASRNDLLSSNQTPQNRLDLQQTNPDQSPVQSADDTQSTLDDQYQQVAATLDQNDPTVVADSPDIRNSINSKKENNAGQILLSDRESFGELPPNGITVSLEDQSYFAPSQNNVIVLTEDPESLTESVELLGLPLKSISNPTILSLAFLPQKIYAVPVYANAEEQENEDKRGGLWAGLNIGSGNFDPNYGAPTGSTDEAALASEDAFAPALDRNTVGLPLQEESRPGPTIAVGIDIGKSVGEKWVIQSGLRYGRYRVNAETNLVFSDPDGRTVPLSFQNREALFSSDEVLVSSETVEVDNNFQLLSVPFKAGFLLLDSRFNILLNAGMSGDIYLGNELTSTNSAFDNYEIDPGGASPYRRVHLNGLTSVQLGYQIQDNYFLSLEPSYRRAFTDFAKTGNSFSSRPSNIGLMIGFRYLFQ